MNLKQTLGLDLRSLALFRTAVAAAVLVDLALRARDLTAHYTEEGVLPATFFLIDKSNWSLHAASGSFWFEVFMFSLAAVCALALLVGYLTRLATFTTWLLTISLQGRNWMLLDSGDGVLRMVLFWGMFLPLGARFSLDCWWSRRSESFSDEPHSSGPYSDGQERAGDESAGEQLLSVATVGYLAQLFIIYWFAVIARTDPDWWNGNALYYALNYDPLVSGWGIWLRELGWPLPALSLGIIWWEVVGPVLVLIPWKQSFFRVLAVAGFAAFHLGIAVFMTIGLFPWVCMIAWLPVLPGRFWDLAKRTMLERRSRAALQWIGGIASRLGRPSGVLEPAAPRVKPSQFGNAVAAFFLIYILLWNLRIVDAERFPLPRHLNFIAYWGGLAQNWNMFTPGPPKADGWCVVPARLENGRKIDLITGEPVNWTKPDLVAELYPNKRWGRYYRNLVKPEDLTLWPRRFYSRYITRTWNENHPPEEHVVEITFYLIREETLPDQIAEPRKHRMWSYRAAEGAW